VRSPAKSAAAAPPSRFRPHPWHGLDPGPDAPSIVDAFIEMTPFDLVKYEVDKHSGYVRVDRPQRLSSQAPALYGFIPRTYCGGRVARLAPGSARGDGDPLDICVFSERPVGRAEILVRSRVVGGLQMIDRGEADDKIIAVLENDPLLGAVGDLLELPAALLERLEHYFLTYKARPRAHSPVRVARSYGRRHALAVITAARADYQELFPQSS
jgi:inorganic pyrophosphatase